MKKQYFLLILCLQIVNILFADGLNPDSTFHFNGYNRVADIYSPISKVDEVQKSIIVAGYKNSGASYAKLGVTKLTLDGAVDSSFGINGNVEISINTLYPGTYSTTVKEIIFQGDGKILLLLFCTTSADMTKGLIGMVRLHNNGSLDNSFSNTGVKLFKLQTGYKYNPTCMAIDESEDQLKIYVGGTAIPETWSVAASEFFIAKFNVNGALDTSFAGNGYIQELGTYINSSLVDGTSVVRDMKVIDSNKLLVAGSHTGTYFFACKLKQDGTFDSTYNNNGRVLRDAGFLASTTDWSNVYILKDNSIAFSTMYIETYNVTPAYTEVELYVARQNAEGASMVSYGNGGILYHSFLTGNHSNKYAFDSLGRMLISYYTNDGSLNRQYVNFTRFSTDGQLDSSFGNSADATIKSEPIINNHFINSSWTTVIEFSENESQFYFCESYHKMAAQYGGTVYRYNVVNTANPPLSIGRVNKLETAVYPNPFKDELQISLSQGEKIKAVAVFDLLGRLILSDPNVHANRLSLDVQAIIPGMYYLQVRSSTGALCVEKIVKE